MIIRCLSLNRTCFINLASRVPLTGAGKREILVIEILLYKDLKKGRLIAKQTLVRESNMTNSHRYTNKK